jgi:hypothetical protein
MNKPKLLVVVCLAVSLTVVGCAPSTTSPPPTPTPVPATTTAAAEAPDTPIPTEPRATESPDTPSPVPPTATPTLPAEPAWQADGLVGAGEYPHMVEVAGVEFHWMNDGEDLYGALAAQTNGWVSVGFDPENQMQGANYIFGYVQDGTPVLQDMFGTQPRGRGSHPPDEQLGGTDDILEYAGSEQGDLTVIEFRIALDSGDEYDKPLSPGATYAIILARGRSDDSDSRHADRGQAQITLD